MKKTKLKIENFLGNKLENQIIIFGGGEVPLEGGPNPRGTSTSSGNGSGDTPPPFDNTSQTPPLPELPLEP